MLVAEVIRSLYAQTASALPALLQKGWRRYASCRAVFDFRMTSQVVDVLRQVSRRTAV